jgi:peptide subunit release factor 1 (eRF1)
VAKDSNKYSILKQLNKEANTALNIKDSDVRKKVLKALNKLIPEVSKTKVNNGYIVYSAFDGI